MRYSMTVSSCRGDTQSAAVLSIDNYGGAEGTRTPDFLLAKEALSQLSYSPTGMYVTWPFFSRSPLRQSSHSQAA